MTQDNDPDATKPDVARQADTQETPRKPLPPAAQRALAEAAARRELDQAAPLPKELQGPDGPEPTRYGDWEIRGIASDF